MSEEKITQSTKRNILLVAIFVAIAVISAITITLGFLSQSIYRDFNVKIEKTIVSFKFNDKTFIDEIGKKDIDIYKGDPTDIDMKLNVTGTSRFYVDYKIEFALEAENVVLDSGEVVYLPNAIEVYYYNGYRYVFLSMLDKLDGQSIEGSLITNVDKTVPLRLVLSPEAGAQYDALLTGSYADDADFRIIASAAASVTSKEVDCTYVSTNEEFTEAFEDLDTAEKTIILSDNITVSSLLTSKGIIGIDLNGFNLTLNDNLVVDCKNAAGKRFGVSNSGQNGSISGPGVISVKNAANCYLIDESLNGYDKGLTGGQVKVNVYYQNYQSIFNDLVSLIKERTAVLESGDSFRSDIYKPDTDVSYLFDGLDAYFGTFNLLIYGDSAVQKTGQGVYKVKVDDEFTTRHLFKFDFIYNATLLNEDTNLNEPVSLSETVSGYVVVRGNSAYSIAESLADSLPQTIDSSQFFRNYDQYTGSYIDWIVDDGTGNDLLSDKGIYRRNGLSAILSGLAAGYPDKKADIFIKVTKGDSTYTQYVTRDVVTVTAEERTVLSYDNVPLTLAKDETYDICDNYLIPAYNAAQTGLTGITIEIVNDPIGYLEVVPGAAGSAYEAVAVKSAMDIPINSLVEVSFNVTFTYGNKSHTVLKTLELSGEDVLVTKYDMTFTLQQPFETNNYTEGKGVTFQAYGALLPLVSGEPVAVLVDYTPTDDAAKYLAVTYTFVEVPYSELSTQIAYFTREPDSGHYYEYDDSTTAQCVSKDGYVYIFTMPDSDGNYDSNKTYYERKAVIEVIRARIPTSEVIYANLTARLYTLNYTQAPKYTLDEYGFIIKGVPDKNSNGTKIYVDPTTGARKSLTYTVMLSMEGIITHSNEHIADGNLYYYLRQIFDINGDGVITVSESRNPLAIQRGISLGYIIEEISTYTGTLYQYLDLSWVNISSLKGLEYFTILEGFDFSNSGRSDLSVFKDFRNLTYLNLADNAVTDLTALKYLDNLEYLNLSNNSISSLEPLKHLPSLTTLYLNNNIITDFDPLMNVATLEKLSLTGMLTAGGASFLTDSAVMYSFAVISVNNPSIEFNYDEPIIILPAMQVAASAVRDLEKVNRVSNTLYLPTYYDYYSYETGTVNQYRLYWYVDPMYENLIRISYSGVNAVYSITSPIQDKQIKIGVMVYTGNGTVTYNFSRILNITLQKGTDNITYIYDYKNDTYLVASEAIPDFALRTLIFDNFNKIVTGSVDINGVLVSEEYVISKADFEFYQSNVLGIFNWSYSDIWDLTGIGYFSELLSSSLNLSGNNFDSKSLVELQKLTELKNLTLGSAEFDFTKLAGGLNKLINLYVYECFGLESDAVLNTLYQVYINVPSCNIFIKKGVVWNPYAVILAKEVRNLPSVVALDNKNKAYDIYEGKGGFLITLYGVEYTFTIINGTMHGSSRYHFQSPGQFIYSNLSGANESDVFKAVLRSTTTDNRSYISYNDYYIQFIAEDLSYKVYVHNTSGNAGSTAAGLDKLDTFNVLPLSSIFKSISIKDQYLDPLFTYFNNYNSIYKIPYENGLTNDQITMRLSKPEYLIAGKYSTYFYYDESTGYYHITTDLMGNTNVFNQDINIYGSNEAGSDVLSGLRYLSINCLYVQYGYVDFGTGKELIGLSTLYVSYSNTDISGICVDLPKLTRLEIRQPNLLNIGDSINSPFEYMKNLTYIYITPSGSVWLEYFWMSGTTKYYSHNTYQFLYYGDLSALGGVVRTNENNEEVCNVQTISAIGLSGGQQATSIESADAVKSVYLAAKRNNVTNLSYQIGSSEQDNVSGYFRVINNISWYCTSNSDDTKYRSWDSGADMTLEVSDLTNYQDYVSYSFDLGLSYKIASTSAQTYWITDKLYYISNTGYLYLPGNTANTYYGLQFGASSTITRYFDIKWTVYRITSAGEQTPQVISTITNPSNPLADYTTLYMGNYTNSTLFIIGTLDNVPAGAVAYSTVYSFVVGGGDGSYSQVSSDALRLYLFSIRNKVTDTINIKTDNSRTYSMNYSDIYTNLGLNILETTHFIQNYSWTTMYSYLYHNFGQLTDLTGIDAVVTKWGKIDTITTINIIGQRVDDLSPLYKFENLKTLALSGNHTNNSWNVTYFNNANISTSISTYVNTRPGNVGKTGAWPNLEIADFGGCRYLTPDLLAYFANTARPNLKVLNLYGTMCTTNYESVAHIKKIIDNTTLRSISLAMDNTGGYGITTSGNNFQQTLYYTVTSTDCSNFITYVTAANLYSGGLNSSSTVVVEGNETRTIAGHSVTFTMMYAVNYMIKNYNVNNNVPVKLIISSTYDGFKPFNNMYIQVTYRRNDVTSPMRFGRNALEITGYDTELIAYLLLQKYLSEYSSGSGVYYLNRNLTMDIYGMYTYYNSTYGYTTYCEIGISSLKNIATLGYAYAYGYYYTLSFAEQTNHWGYHWYYSSWPHNSQAMFWAYREYSIWLPSLSVTSSFNISKTSLANLAVPTTYLFHAVSNGLYHSQSYYYNDTVTYGFIEGSQYTYTALLPRYYYSLGTKYEIKYVSVTNNVPNSSTNIANFITTTTNGYELKIGPNNINPQIAGSWTFQLNAEVYDGATRLTTYYKTFAVRKSLADAPQIKNNFYLEVDVVGTDVVMLDDYNQVHYRIGSTVSSRDDYVETYGLDTVNGVYYLYNISSGGFAARTIINAYDVFDQSLAWFLYLDNCRDQFIYRNVSGMSVRDGYIMTAEQISNMDTISFYYMRKTLPDAGSYFGSNVAVSSLEGIQVFYNLKNLQIRSATNITSLAPLASMQLETFFYYGGYNNTYITDFSPLLEGSRHTLKNFVYGISNNNYVITDFSFLLCFTNSDFAVYMSSNSVYSSSNMLQYFKTSSGQYVLNRLYERGIYIYVPVAAAEYSGFDLDYSKKKEKSEYADSIGTYDLYALRGSGDHLVAERILSEFDPAINETYDPAYTSGVSVNDNYKLFIDSSVRSVSGNKVTFELAASVMQDNAIYHIEWMPANSLVKVDGYRLEKPITIDGVTYSGLITVDQAKIVGQSMQYYQVYKTNNNRMVAVITVDTMDITMIAELTNARIVSRTYVDGYGYERMFTFSF